MIQVHPDVVGRSRHGPILAPLTESPPTVPQHDIPPEVFARRWRILALLCLSLVVVVTAVSALNIAIPEIQRETGASQTQVQWLIDAYALVFAGLLLPAGALGDRFGRRGALQVGLLVFGAAALLATMSASANALIVARTISGVGAAFVMPATLSIIVTSFPMGERPKAIAVWAAFAGVGGALGPISSGLLLDHFWWGSVFLVNLPIVAVLLAGSVVVLPTSRNPHGHALDLVGAALSIVALGAFVFGVIEGPERGWTDPATLAGFVLGVAGGIAFVRYELAATNPMLDPRLFRLRAFSGGTAVVTLAFFNAFTMFFLLTQYLQFVKEYSALRAGLCVLPNALSMIAIAPRGPLIIGRFGVRRTLRVGFFVAATGFAILAFAGPGTPYALIAIALIGNGAGMAVIVPSASQQIVAALPIAKAGVGSAVNDVTREVGGALGIALGGSVVATVYRSQMGDYLDTRPQIPAAARDAIRDSIGGATTAAARALDAGTDPSLVAATLDRARDAFSSGMHWAFTLTALTGYIAGWFLPRRLADRLPERPH
jgi:EmrB/QacA subfamily drug resistance transporter